MAILTDLPNELLLKIIANVSPLYLDLFLLSCKRIYLLRADATREYHLVKSSLTGLNSCDLLEKVFSDASKALYPTSTVLQSCCGLDYEDAVFSVNIQALKGLFQSRYGSIHPRPDLAIPLLFTLLLNLRKLEITVGHSPYLIEIAAQIVEASHEPSLILQEPLALGRLTEVVIWACFLRVTTLDTFLPAHIISVESPNSLHLSGAVDSTFLEDLIGRTKSLEKFTYQHEISNAMFPPANFAPRRVAQLLQQVAGDSLLYLDLMLHPSGYVKSNDHLRRYRKDLFIGPLQGLTALETLRTSIDLLIKTRRIGRNHAKTHAKTGTVQSLMSILPPSLETLVLDEGLKAWDANTMELLFEDITEWKERSWIKVL